jgi:hypothetical protein
MASGIEWYYPEHGQIPNGTINDIVSHLPGVEREVKLKANSMASEAWLQLMWHHKTGAAHIEVARHPKASARTPDWYVYMRDRDPGGEGIGNATGNKRDRSAMSIEFGWTQTHVFGRKLKEPIHHDGLHILGSVMDRAAAKYKGPR